MESTLLGVFADPLKHFVLLTFRTNKREFRLRAEGIEHMLVNEFLQQNIVDRVHAWGHVADPSHVKNLLASLLFDCENASEISAPQVITRLDDYVADVSEGRKILFQVSLWRDITVLLLAKSLEWIDGSGQRSDGGEPVRN